MDSWLLLQILVLLLARQQSLLLHPPLDLASEGCIHAFVIHDVL